MDSVSSYLDAANFSNHMTTSRRHVEMICDLSRGKTVLEIGSHVGISSTAIALAGGIVTSVDLCDTISEQDRVAHWTLHGVTITPWAGAAEAYLENCGKFDVVFHDARHGECALSEYLACADICSTLVIHDFEQLSPAGQATVVSRTSENVTDADERGRVLFIGKVLRLRGAPK